MPVRKSILAFALLCGATTVMAAKPSFGSIRVRLDEWDFLETCPSGFFGID